jgi:hypothetical protein
VRGGEATRNRPSQSLSKMASRERESLDSLESGGEPRGGEMADIGKLRNPLILSRNSTLHRRENRPFARIPAMKQSIITCNNKELNEEAASLYRFF